MTSHFARLSALLTSAALTRASAFGISTPDIVTPTTISEETSRHFLRGLDAGLVFLENDGQCRLPSLHSRIKKPTQPHLMCRKGHSTLYLCWVEFVVQVGTAVQLILDYGWPPDRLALDPELDQAFDLGGYIPRGSTERMVLAVEVKKAPREMASTLRQMHALLGCPGPLSGTPANDGLKKVRGLLKHRPTLFWAVSPDAAEAFSVQYPSDRPLLTPLPALPLFASLA